MYQIKFSFRSYSAKCMNTWSTVYLKIYPLRNRVLGHNYILNTRPDNRINIHKICVITTGKSSSSGEDIP